MKYEITFTGTKEDKERAAFNACVEYLGKQRFNNVCNEIARSMRGWPEPKRTARNAYRQVQFYCGAFLGIAGYWPRRAMFKHIWALV